MMSKRALVLLALALGCPREATTPTPEVVAIEQPTPKVHHFRDNWGTGLGCEPRGEVLAIHGTIRIEPFRKGTDGAVLEADDGERWVLSYRAEDVLLSLDGARVEARGRACDKQGEAISGEHFDLQTLTELSDGAR